MSISPGMDHELVYIAAAEWMCSMTKDCRLKVKGALTGHYQMMTKSLSD